MQVLLPQVPASLWLRQNFKAVSSLTVMKLGDSSVTHCKSFFWSLNVFVVCFLEVAMLLLLFNGSLFISFMCMDLYIPGALLTSHQPERSPLQQSAALSLLNANNQYLVHWWWWDILRKGSGADFFCGRWAGSSSCFSSLAQILRTICHL